MKMMKKAISMVLVLGMLIGTFSVVCCTADTDDEGDVFQCTGWYLNTDSTYSKVYELILHPRFVERAAVIRIMSEASGEDAAELENFLVQRKTVDGVGECFVVYLATLGGNAYLQPDSFFDQDGNGNAKICISDFRYFTQQNFFKLDQDFFTRAVDGKTEQGESTTIGFAIKGTVTYDNKTLAENVDTYTLEFSETGEHTLTVSVNDVIRWSFTLEVKSAEQLRKENIAELRRKLVREAVVFLESIPLSVITIPLIPIMIVWPFVNVLPFGPLVVASQFFHTLSELWHLRFGR